LVKLTFVQPAPFASRWKKLKLTDEDLQALEQKILRDPEEGAVMSGTGGLRKMRFAPPSWRRGKSGGARMCYICFTMVANCYLLDIYTHNDKDNLSDAEKAEFKAFIYAMKTLLNEE
jgi:hypothetical protein